MYGREYGKIKSMVKTIIGVFGRHICCERANSLQGDSIS